MPYANVPGVPYIRSQSFRSRRPPISWRTLAVITFVILPVTLFSMIWFWFSTSEIAESGSTSLPHGRVVVDAVVMPLRDARCELTPYGRICKLAGRHGCVQLKHVLGPRPSFVEVVAAAGVQSPACGGHGGTRPSSVRVHETWPVELDVCADLGCYEES